LAVSEFMINLYMVGCSVLTFWLINFFVL
jgi:hypothetical protein